MSRFHRVIFHPTRPDTSPHLAPVDRKRHGKHSGHVPPPWVAEAGTSAPKAAPAASPGSRKDLAARSLAKSNAVGKRTARTSGRKPKS